MTLAVEDLTVRRSGRLVVDRVSFTATAGQVFVLVGANGAGKTSLIEAMLGLLPTDGGQVRVGNHQARDLPTRARLFSFMPDGAEPPSEVRVDTLLRHAARYGRAAPELSSSLTERLGLLPLRNARAGDLSRGEKRRVSLFTALCSDRPVIALDEPLGAFDPLQLGAVLDLLRERARAGRVLVLSVHQLSDAEKIADRVLILDTGRVLACGTLDELRARLDRPHASLEELFLGLLQTAHAEA